MNKVTDAQNLLKTVGEMKKLGAIGVLQSPIDDGLCTLIMPRDDFMPSKDDIVARITSNDVVYGANDFPSIGASVVVVKDFGKILRDDRMVAVIPSVAEGIKEFHQDWVLGDVNSDSQTVELKINQFGSRACVKEIPLDKICPVEENDEVLSERVSISRLDDKFCGPDTIIYSASLNIKKRGKYSLEGRVVSSEKASSLSLEVSYPRVGKYDDIYRVTKDSLDKREIVEASAQGCFYQKSSEYKAHFGEFIEPQYESEDGLRMCGGEKYTRIVVDHCEMGEKESISEEELSNILCKWRKSPIPPKMKLAWKLGSAEKVEEYNTKAVEVAKQRLEMFIEEHRDEFLKRTSSLININECVKGGQVKEIIEGL